MASLGDDIEKLLDAVDNIVMSDTRHNWQVKRDLIIRAVETRQGDNFAEFMSWFERPSSTQ